MLLSSLVMLFTTTSFVSAYNTNPMQMGMRRSSIRNSISNKILRRPSSRNAVAIEPPPAAIKRQFPSFRNKKPKDVPTLETSALHEELGKKRQKNDEFMVDMTGIHFSGMKGQALKWKHEDFPSASELRSVIPKDCFKPETKTSLKYLSVSVIGTTLCAIFGAQVLLPYVPPTYANWFGSGILKFLWTSSIWSTYAVVKGTVAMGLWVLAHECGHGAFSKNKSLQDKVGYILHSFFLVPYYSWQHSHAVHHKFTNHMDLGETHVPEPVETLKEDSVMNSEMKETAAVTNENGGTLGARKSMMKMLGVKWGLRAWGSLQGFMHLIIGWPAYLWIGATGSPDRGMTNHYWPNPLTKPKNPKQELFPGQWKRKVLGSDIGVAIMGAGLLAYSAWKGIPTMMAMYGLPLIVVNAWLVIYTWLQHTDVDVPHFSAAEHNYVKGALHTIDRPYNKLDPWGLIDFLHHQIGTTHVAHHFASTIPHYKAQAATDAIQKSYPDLYLYDPTPIPQALWRVCKGCTAVEKRGDRWVWTNKNIPKHML